MGGSNKELQMDHMELEIRNIVVGGRNPRKNFKGEAFEEIVSSVKTHGIIEPLIVRPTETIGTYELVAGERRLRAAKEAGLSKVPTVVMLLSDAEALEVMLVENLVRENLEPLEEASALQELLSSGLTETEMGKKLGKSQGWVGNRLRLLNAPKELKDLLISRKITPRHTLEVLPVVGYPVYAEKVLPALQRELKADGGLTVEDTRELVDTSCMTRRGDEKLTVLDLDDFPFEVRDHRKYFDFTGCDSCQHIRRIKERFGSRDVSRNCLNRQCWADRLNQAKHKYEKANAKVLEKLKDKKVVDTNKLDWGKYRRLDAVHFDKTECKSCDKSKREKDDLKVLICLDPACAAKKESAVTRAKNKAASEERKKALELLDVELKKIKVIGVREQRFLLERLSEETWSAPVNEALKPWDGKIKKVSDAELPMALIRLACFGFLEHNRYSGGITRAKIKQIMRKIGDKGEQRHDK